jgi:hypothetical protein
MPETAETALEGVYSLLDELMADPRLKTYFDHIKQTQNPLADARKELQGRTYDLITEIEKRLSAAIGDQPLRGCPNIFISKAPLWAWNVRKSNKREPLKLPVFNGAMEAKASSLVLLHESAFAVVEVTGKRRRGRNGLFDDFSYEIFELEEDDVRIEDVMPCVETVLEACAQHISRSEKTARETERVKKLFDALEERLRSFEKE